MAENSTPETVLHPRQLLIVIELSVGHQAGVVIEEGEKEHPTILVGVSRIGEIGPVHGIALPQVAEVGSFEASVGLGPLFAEQLSGGGIPQSQVATQGARSDGLLRDRVGLVEREDLDDGARGSVWLFALQRLGAVQCLLRDCSGLALIGPGAGLQALETIGPVVTLPSSERRGAHGGARRVGNIVVAAGDALPQFLLPAGRMLAPHKREDERVPQQRNFGAPVFGL